jgi:CDP-glycerol glycerophosphotransferase (TagB/SpsB family)
MDLNFSNFLRYYDFMIQLAKEYKDKVFITFKPHPLLRTKLNYNNIWGKEKTDTYYNFWTENDFCGFNDGNYISLFEQSDAMIHDCDSFMGEYLSLNQPVLYTRKDARVKDRMNEFGRSANDVHYQAKNEQEIVSFIDEVVINGMDPMRQIRSNWIKTHIIPPNNTTASMNIFNDLKASLNID